MNKITIYTDGSYINIYKRKGAGIAFLCLFPDSQIQTVGYSAISVYNITKVEILAVTYALKYLISLNIEYDCIEIMCDNIGIVNFFRNKEYIGYQNRGWKKTSGKPINRCVKLLYELTCIVNNFPEGKLVFIKANKSSMGNKIVHFYARIATNLDTSAINSLYIKKSNFIYNEFMPTQVNDSLKIEKETAYTLVTDNSKPQKVGRSLEIESERESNRKIKWLDVINQDIVNIHTADIILTEDIHLRCKELNLQGMMKKSAKNMTIDKPIAVKEMGNNRYALVMGLTRLIIAKVLGIPYIPCIITELNFNEFKREYDAE